MPFRNSGLGHTGYSKDQGFHGEHTDGAFNPADTSPEAYYHVDDCAGVGDGNPITTWTDRSGNGHDADFYYPPYKASYEADAGGDWSGLPCVECGYREGFRSAAGLQSDIDTEGALFLVARQASTGATFLCRCEDGFTVNIEISNFSDTPKAYAKWGDKVQTKNPLATAAPRAFLVQDNKMWADGNLEMNPIGAGASFSGNSSLKMTLGNLNSVGTITQVFVVLYWRRYLNATEITNMFQWVSDEGYS